jgi:lactam utilization protein B
MKFDLLKALSAVESIAIIGGIVFAVWQVLELSKQTTIQAQNLSEISKQTALQAETLKQSQQVASADLVLKFRAALDENKFKQLVADIQNHDRTYPLLTRSDGGKVGKSRDLDIEQYISVFEDIGYLLDGNLIISKMAYNEFSYDVEKAWCNIAVQEVIRKQRATDKSKTAQSEPFFGNFERLATQYLTDEGQTCNDMDKQ